MGTDMSPLHKIEAVLSDPDLLRHHLTVIPPGCLRLSDATSDDELENLLELLVEDDRRLAVLSERDLELLANDAGMLLALASETMCGNSRAWRTRVAAAGAEYRRGTRISPSPWERITDAHGVYAPGEPAASAADGSLGRVVDGESEFKHTPALLLDWHWSASAACITWDAFGALHNARVWGDQAARFRLRALRKRGNAPGAWLLEVDAPDLLHGINRITAWIEGAGGTPRLDTTTIIVGVSPIEIRLSDFGDPSNYFEGWDDDPIILNLHGEGSGQSWQHQRIIPGPRVNRAFYEQWIERDKNGSSEFDACVCRLRSRLRRRDQPDPDLLDQAIETASRQIYRARYDMRYHCLDLDEFSRLVLVAAEKRYWDLRRRPGPRTLGTLKAIERGVDQLAAEKQLFLQELRNVQNTCMASLDTRQQQAVVLRTQYDAEYDEIAARLQVRKGTARVIICRAMAKLADCYKRHNYGTDDLARYY